MKLPDTVERGNPTSPIHPTTTPCTSSQGSSDFVLSHKPREKKNKKAASFLQASARARERRETGIGKKYSSSLESNSSVACNSSDSLKMLQRVGKEKFISVHVLHHNMQYTYSMSNDTKLPT